MIDNIDLDILRIVQMNARISNKDLADAVGVSPSTMVNRLRNLESSGAIRGYHADVDPAALGRNVQALVSLSLQPKSPQAVAEFEEAIWALDETIAIWLVTGESDVLLHLSDRSVTSLAETILSHVASAPNVVSERTAIVFSHRRKVSLSQLGD
ncbi:MAG: DNA-binding Lrp family transcriptional regulator [Verrucomicrobiales bacterium]|jgi:DNA-binding Lrp family transcriptional regulator